MGDQFSIVSSNKLVDFTANQQKKTILSVNKKIFKILLKKTK